MEELHDQARDGSAVPELLRVAAWAAYPWLLHGFTTRRRGLSTAYRAAGQTAGELNLGFTADDDPANVQGNRAALASAFTADASDAFDTRPLVLVRQVHGTDVRTVHAGEAERMMVDGRAVHDGDGLVTAEPGLLLGVQVADCVPVLIADTRLRIVAAVHAGWRGTVGGIVSVAIRQMRQMGSQPADLTAAIGPSIGPCCYAVGGEVEERFRERYAYADELFSTRAGNRYLNLWESNRRQLQDAAIAPERITTLAQCSACAAMNGERLFFSHRADHGRSGRMMGVIGISAGV